MEVSGISKEPKLLFCETNIIYKPKPRKLYKSNLQLSPSFKLDLNEFGHKNFNHKKKRKKEILDLNLKKNTKSQNFELISFEEIENDFKKLKFQSERVQVENELLKLLENSTEDTSSNEDDIIKKKIKRPKIAYFSNID